MNKVEKEKLLMMGNFSLCQNVYKSGLMQRHQKVSVFGKGITKMLIGNGAKFLKFIAKKYINSNEIKIKRSLGLLLSLNLNNFTPPFPQTTYLRQVALKISRQNKEDLYNCTYYY